MGGHFRVILAVLAVLEGLLERLGLVVGRLEASGTVLKGSWELLGGLGSLLETSWEPSWRLWELAWGCLERLGPEKKFIYKKEKTSMSRGLPILASILELCFIDFGSFFLVPGKVIL